MHDHDLSRCSCHVPLQETVSFMMEATYTVGTPQWFAQKRAIYMQKHGVIYSPTEQEIARREQRLRDLLTHWDARILASVEEQKRGNAQQLAPSSSRPAAQTPSSSRPAAQTPSSSPAAQTPSSSPAAPQRPYHTEEMLHFGVIDDSYVYSPVIQENTLRIQRTRYTRPIEHAGDLLQLAIECNLLSLWILPETALSRRGDRLFAEDATKKGWDILVTAEGKEGMLESFQGYEKSPEWKPTHYVIYAEHNTSWELEDCLDVKTFVATLLYLETAINVPMKQSPSSIGLAMLRGTLTGTRETWLSPTVPSDWERKGVADIQWKRKLTEEETRKKYILCFDKNSMYLAACSGLQLGNGLPTYYSENPPYQEKMPALYHVKEISGFSPFDGQLLPSITNGGKFDLWLWTPSIAFLKAQGYYLDIDKGYVWQSSHRTLEDWARLVWEARSSLKHNTPQHSNTAACELAYAQIKNIATQTVGRLNSPLKYDSKKAARDYHPDWNAMIIDHARVRILWRCLKLSQEGYSPFMLYTDGLYIVSDEKEAEYVLPQMLKQKESWGGYKVPYYVPLDAVKDAIQEEKLAPSELISLFKKHAIRN